MTDYNTPATGEPAPNTEDSLRTVWGRGRLELLNLEEPLYETDGGEDLKYQEDDVEPASLADIAHQHPDYQDGAPW